MSEPKAGDISEQVTHNIETIAELHSLAEQRRTGHQRAVEAFTALVARPVTVQIIVAIVLAWSILNVELPRLGVAPLDAPPFFWLQGAVALYAALVGTAVLTTQTRLNKEGERRAHLEFQVNLLAEQRTAKIVALLEELRRDLPNVHNRVDAVADALQDAVDPKAVLTMLEETFDTGEAGSGAPAEPGAPGGSAPEGGPAPSGREIPGRSTAPGGP